MYFATVVCPTSIPSESFYTLREAQIVIESWRRHYNTIRRPRLNRIQATSTRGVRARIRRVAGCATPTGSASHASATASLKLTFHLDHSVGANQPAMPPQRHRAWLRIFVV
jgi:hypothetical protein